MDIERIQKINTLALDLMRQGLATDREDAVQQAERIFRSRDSNEDYSSVRQTMKEVQADAQRDQRAPNASVLPAEKVQEILEQNTKFMVSTIKQFQEKIEAMDREIADLKTKMTYNRPQASTVSQSPAPSSASSPASAPAQEIQRGTVKPVSKDHPRSGNYNEGDVSIEKFFYMGHK